MAEDDDIPQPVYEDDEPDSGIFRWMSALVVVLAVAGFFGLAWYAYRNGGDSVDEKDVELIKADTTPVKEAPANPGGMQIPNQDKTVYGLISGKTEKPVVERILPAPEEPMPRTGGDTQTWMSDSFKGKASGDEAKPELHADGTPMTPKEQFNPAKVKTSTPATNVAAFPESGSGSAPVESTKQIATATPQSLPVIPPAATAPTTPPAPNSSTGTVVSMTPAQPNPPAPPAAPARPADDSGDADDTTEKTPAAKPAQAASASASAPSGVRVQLGAFKSQGEAESNWKKIASKFSDDIGGKQHYVVKADLGSKGIYYRLQLAPFDSSGAAEQFCIDFVSAGQNCIVARGK